MAGWRPMEKLARSGRLVEHAQAVARALGFEVADAVDRRRLRRQHDVGHGRAVARRPRTDRRQRPQPGGVPRGRLGRAADQRWSPGSCWPSRGTRTCWRGGPTTRGSPGLVTDRRRPARGSRAAARGRRPTATAGRSSSATRAGSPARPTPDRMGTRQHPGDAAGQATAVFAIIERALGDAGFALADVVRTRMFVIDIADADAVAPGPRRGLPASPAGRDAGPGRRASSTRRCSSRSRSTPGADQGRSRASTDGDARGRPRDDGDRHGHDEAEEQVPPPQRRPRGRRGPRSTRCRSGRAACRHRR